MTHLKHSYTVHGGHRGGYARAKETHGWVDHGNDVGKAIAFTETGRRKKAEDERLRATLSRREGRRALWLGTAASFLDAPKGKKVASRTTHLKHAYTVHGGHRGGYARAKETHGW